MAKSDLRIDWATHQAAKYACENWHYSKSMPMPPLVKIGIWENSQFIGVVIFSRGANNNLLKPFGLDISDGCELSRIALCDHSAQVSRIIRLALLFLRKSDAGLRLIVSFADPSQGHHGGVYQATGWIYSGQQSGSTKYISPDNKQWHRRMVSKTGVTKIFGRSTRVWRFDQCRAVETPGKHRYLMPLDAEMRAQIAPLSKPYPKRGKQAMASDQVAQRRGSADRHAPNAA